MYRRVCVHAYVYMHVYGGMLTCMHVHQCVHTCVYRHVCQCAHVWECVHRCRYVCVWVCACMRVYACVYESACVECASRAGGRGRRGAPPAPLCTSTITDHSHQLSCAVDRTVQVDVVALTRVQAHLVFPWLVMSSQPSGRLSSFRFFHVDNDPTAHGNESHPPLGFPLPRRSKTPLSGLDKMAGELGWKSQGRARKRPGRVPRVWMLPCPKAGQVGGGPAM